MGIYTEAVQKLYVAYFNRPADFGGLAYWEKIVTAANGNTSAVSAAFAASQEYKDTYAGKSAFQVINTIYNNLFGRDAEPAALLFWGDALNNRAVTIDNAVTTIAAAAQNADAVAYKNKVAAATAFSASLDTTSEILGYDGAKANEAAKIWLSTVSTDASLAAAIAPAALSTTVNNVAQIGLSTTGTTVALTTGVDTLTGTAGNDTFNGLIDATSATSPATTLTALDSINGGTGADTLAITALTAMTAAPSISVSNVEVVTVRAASTVTADISAWTGVEQFNITEASGNVNVAAAGTTNINATLKANGAAVTAVNGGKDVVVKMTDVASTAQDINVGLVTAAKGVVSVESIGKAAVLGSGLTLGDINVKGGTTVNVTQTATSAAPTGVGAATTYNLGAVTVTGEASTTTVNVKQTATISAREGIADVAEVQETTTLKFSAVTGGQTVSVGGLTFTASKNLTAAEVASAFSNLVRGTVPVAGDTQGSGLALNGTYTGALNGWNSAAANGDSVTFTARFGGVATDLTVGGTATLPTPTTVQGVDEDGQVARLGVNTGVVTVNDAAGSIKTISIDAYANGSSIIGGAVLDTLNLSNAASGAGINVADTAATLALNLSGVASTGGTAAIGFTAAPTTLNVKSTGANRATITAAATETLNVSGTGTLTAGAGLSGVKTIVVTETAGLSLSGSAASITSVNTTGTTGTVTTTIDGSKATYTGGAGVDTVTLSTTSVTKAITLGAGNDRVNLADGTTAIATEGSIAAGDGTDILGMLAADAVTASQGTTFAGKVTGFERLYLRGATGTQEVEADVLGAFNDIGVNAVVGGSITIDGLTSGATLRLSDNTNVATTLKIKGAADSTADVANIIITAVNAVDGNNDSNGTVTIAEVETINITTADGLTESPTNFSPDTQNLTLAATKAKAIVVTGNTALNLTNTGNINVASIDGSAMTAALTVQAAGNTATTITGGSGNDILTASAQGGGNIAQVSTLTFTNGAGTAGIAANDQIKATVAGQDFTQNFTGDFNATIAALALQINNSVPAGVNATAVNGVITITAENAGTAFSANTSFTSAYTAANVTGAYAEGNVNYVADVDTITFTDGAAAGALDGDDALTVTVNGKAFTQTFVTDFAATVAALAGQINAEASLDATATAGVITVTGTNAPVVITAVAGVNGTTPTTATGVTAEGAVNFVADADTLVITETAALGAGDTIRVNITNANGSVSTADIAFNTDLDTTMAAVAAAADALAGFDASYVAGTNTLTVTDALGNVPVTGLSLSVVDKTTSLTSSFTTTTSNQAVVAASDVLIGGAGNDILVSAQGMATLTGGAGADLFRVGAPSLNVNSYATITDFTSADLIQFAGADSFAAARVTLGATAVFQDYANAAINSIGGNDLAWFQFNGDTYIVMDAMTGLGNGTTFENGHDMIVKLTGTVDLSNASFNAQYGTVGLI
ncbi:DUF4214 domain-containing protein [Massilia yuzhufengensis]|uniref:DUF4214 domain-containing protein n=1 Tax=Massilia yuzhufengensis TaxID=1164594 RepID=A0A1I1VQG6_9BURK|nr:DUF4214 domain-containing protein [Massilia yuzhufengensis]SFD85191.1 protein of unknown function [Massilia yuzhufengensis]